LNNYFSALRTSALTVVRTASSGVALVAACAAPLLGQRDSLGNSVQRPYGDLLVARRAEGAISLDDRLDDAAWTTADSIVDFRQREPVEGAPASERTVVKLLRDADALYVSVRAYDREPARIRATQLRRDADLTVDDYVTVLIDGFDERRGAFLFRTNPNGAMWDAQLTGFDDTNENWNGVWDVVTRRDSQGWLAEFRIPFQTLRFRPGRSSIGFNVDRFIRRKNEETMWHSYGRTQGLTNLLYAGHVTGFGDIVRGHNMELRPYVLSRLVEAPHDSAGTRTGNGFASGKLGGDAKIALSPTVTADFTANTDFAQVEADQQVVNLTRFPLFFPEKREFFLESSGLFDFGTPGRAQLFYSRRIGLSDSGTTVPILGGARVYGKEGPWSFGALDARTGRGEEANDAVLRVRHDLFARSYIGAMFTQRSSPGVNGAEQSGGLDADFPLVVRGHNVEPSFWISGTRTPHVSGTPIAWRYGTDYPNDLFDNFISLYSIDSGYSPALGFVRRTGIWETTGHINYMPRPGILGIRQLNLTIPIPTWDIIANRTGSLTRTEDWQTATFEWRFLGGDFQSGDRFEANLQRFLDAPTGPFEIFRGVNVHPGRYWWTRGELQYSTSEGRPLSVGSFVSWGHFYDGRNTEVSLSGTWRGGGHVILGADVDRNDVRLDTGRFVAVQTSGRLEYAFSTRTNFLSFVQYNNEDRRVDFNLRFHWIPTIGDDVYVVWNSGYTTEPTSRFRFPRSQALGRPLNGALIIKAVHLLAR
jgi:hypothetical protein